MKTRDQLPITRLVVDGSMITQQSQLWTSASISNSLRGWLTPFNYLTKQVFDINVWRYSNANGTFLLGGNRGFDTSNTSDALKRFQDTLALGAGLYILQGGSVDLNSGISTDVVGKLVENMVVNALDTGAKVVLLSEPYRQYSNSVAPVKRHYLNSLKRHIADTYPNCRYVDTDVALINPVTGTIKSGYLMSDGISLTTEANFAIAQAIVAGIRDWIPARPVQIWQDDLYDATNNPWGNVLNNPRLYLDAQGWTLTNTGSTVTSTMRTISSGELEITLTCSGAGTAGTEASVTLAQVSSVQGNVGQAYRARADISYVSGPAVYTAQAWTRITSSDGEIYAGDLERIPAPLGNTSYIPCQSTSLPGISRTPALVVEKDASSIRGGVKIWVNPAVAGKTVVRLRGISVNRQSLPWIRQGVPQTSGLSSAPGV